MTLQQEGAKVEARSASLRKEPGVRDLALARSCSSSASPGSASRELRLARRAVAAGRVLFYLPLVVVWSSAQPADAARGRPLPVGELGFNHTIGFMVAWNLWLYCDPVRVELGLTVATYLSYALGPRRRGVDDPQHGFVRGIRPRHCAPGAAGVRGPRHRQSGPERRRRVHDHDLAVLILLPFLGLATGHLQSYHPFRTEVTRVLAVQSQRARQNVRRRVSGFQYMRHPGRRNALRPPAR